ncbi:DUF423 domain-containing protein [Phormidium tenue]|uniref:DUF423 domain-containing protein n=1 Tax=Phormidium tenue NIES-30 TaxID=549789 RepID=A0A1U7J8S2_9CYAN|nr:DUF423 domain-containing protein [Phormidium tenue]MBD2231061.1 DUF423 domain-containing protein [Phormidium tenue FACHB-1052]OKH49907.1 hypothetical protein NIES30_04125 [Phormidium tenue NIES-30]
MIVERLWIAIAAVLGGTAVAAGAFATHALKPQLSDRLLTVFETAARYQMYHALALLLVALVRHQGLGPPGWLAASAWALIAGTVVFSGSLYALALTNQSMLGAVAPIGGAALMAGWACLAIAGLLGTGEG